MQQFEQEYEAASPVTFVISLAEIDKN